MSLTNEWNEFHLTPDGWVEGSCKEDFRGVTEVAVPADRVMTMKCSEYQSCSFAKPEYSREITWRCDDADAISALLEKHGPGPLPFAKWPLVERG